MIICMPLHQCHPLSNVIEDIMFVFISGSGSQIWQMGIGSAKKAWAKTEPKLGQREQTNSLGWANIRR